MQRMAHEGRRLARTLMFKTLGTKQLSTQQMEGGVCVRVCVWWGGGALAVASRKRLGQRVQGCFP